MHHSGRIAVALAVLAALVPFAAHGERKTVCTITVNSPDERETFRRYLPAGDYDFVELVERGRPDWLASACRRNVRCDALIISGHFDGGDVFYTDRFDQSESLPTDELDRASCSDSCPGVFSQLKEVYLFGCNTLNAQPAYTPSPEIVAQPDPRRALACRSAATCARARRAARAKQSRPDATDLPRRAGHLRILVEGAARPQRRSAARALLPGRRGSRRRDRQAEREAPRIVRAKLDDRRDRHDGDRCERRHAR